MLQRDIDRLVHYEVFRRAAGPTADALEAANSSRLRYFAGLFGLENFILFHVVVGGHIGLNFTEAP